MDLSTLENWLWKAACSIRGEVDAARYKDYILPLLFYKRLNDVFQDELRRVARDFSGQETPDAQAIQFAEQMVEMDRDLVRFFVPSQARWAEVRKQTVGLGQRLTDTLRQIARENRQAGGRHRPAGL